ncbi:MAG: dephospho-CoA kinase [Betaproteobacteria bacterium]|nr:dephospho-CoA kinase [Betaproteobacteria bacterium]
MSFVVALTGGIGSGKSTVADLFAARGAALVDSDAIAHELTGAGGAAMPLLQNAFGPAIVTPEGALDRSAMRRLAFADSGVRGRLEAILHPLIRQESDRRCQVATAPYVILAIPLLVEGGACRERADRVLVVDCSEAEQVARVMARSGLSALEVERIMAAQASRQQRLAAADDVIDNSGAVEALASRVEALHRQYLTMAAAKVART